MTSTSTPYRLAPVNRSSNMFRLNPGSSRLTMSTMGSPNAVRGNDFSLALLSEVAFWKASAKFNPDDYIRSVCGPIDASPGTCIVMESTANGVGSFFHRQWLRANEGNGALEPLFVPWHLCEYYELPIDDYEAFCRSMDSYEWMLWENGLTLEQIAWYHEKRREFTHHSQMMAEYPTTAQEAFVDTSGAVFPMEHVERLRLNACQPQVTGDIEARKTNLPLTSRDVSFHLAPSGPLSIWTFPQPDARYVVGVDIGGVSNKADWSVITVMDHTPGRKPEVVATWRGHIDHDLLAQKCLALATWYNNALLVVESNTLESEHTDGDPASFILNRMARRYRNLYYRVDATGRARSPGMHINRATKSAVMAELIAAVRDNAYVERDHRACDELEQYERKPNGALGARDGCHDDLVMTRALIFGAIAQIHTGTNPGVDRFLGQNS